MREIIRSPNCVLHLKLGLNNNINPHLFTRYGCRQPISYRVIACSPLHPCFSLQMVIRLCLIVFISFRLTVVPVCEFSVSFSFTPFPKSALPISVPVTLMIMSSVSFPFQALQQNSAFYFCSWALFYIFSYVGLTSSPYQNFYCNSADCWTSLALQRNSGDMLQPMYQATPPCKEI